jgi:hypothetical protein
MELLSIETPEEQFAVLDQIGMHRYVYTYM